MKNEKGIALLTTLILGLVAVVFISVLLYILSTGTRMSGMIGRYTTSLEAAKGGADLVITKIINDDIKCGGNACTPCPDTPNTNCKIDLQVSNLGGYNLSAYLIGEDSTIYAGTAYRIYAIKVIATKPNSDEKAEIEFVYKIE
ncbi:hypothetical protein [Persephonella sp.]|uniref:hypothetical protein n=1 Tax=Persephonella sp. TaxID=2060922 RepID=UPI0025D38CBE|nr:hypothetical protein [Persephonella sp.]